MCSRDIVFSLHHWDNCVARPTSAVMHIIGKLLGCCQAIKGSQQASALQGYSVPSAAAAVWTAVRSQVPMADKKQLMCGFKCQPHMLLNCKPNYWKHHLVCLCRWAAISPFKRSTFHFEPPGQIINLLCQKGTLKSSGFISHIHLVGGKKDRWPMLEKREN